MKTLNDYQKYFDIDLNELLNMSEEYITENKLYMSQTHFGDFQIEKYDQDYERYILYRNLDENIQQGEPLIQIEYAGEKNNHSYETVFELRNI